MKREKVEIKKKKIFVTKRRTIVAIFMAMVILSACAFVGCSKFNLADYKESGKIEIETYAESRKKENDYTKAGLQAIAKAVADGKDAVDAADSKATVDTAVDETKAKINAVSKKSKGSFYSLQEAYEDRRLTLADLQSIARHHKAGTLPYDMLSADIVNAIKKTAAENMCNHELTPVENAKADDFSILRYYGTYNDCVVIMIDDPYHDYPAVELDIMDTIAGVQFHYTNPNKIVVWQQ